MPLASVNTSYIFVSIRETHTIFHPPVPDVSFPCARTPCSLPRTFRQYLFHFPFSFCFWGTKGFSLRLLVTALPSPEGRKRGKTGRSGGKSEWRGRKGGGKGAKEETCFISASTIAKACWTGKSSGNYCIEQRSFTLFIPLPPSPSLSSRRTYKSTLRCKMQNCICLPLLAGSWGLGMGADRGKSGQAEVAENDRESFSDIVANDAKARREIIQTDVPAVVKTKTATRGCSKGVACKIHEYTPRFVQR